MRSKDQPPEGTSKYGGNYWCIRSTVSPNGEIYLNADRLEVTEAGALIAWGGPRDKSSDAPSPDVQIPVFAVAAGHWTAAYSASILDGAPVAVEPWKRGVRG
jgi:hypothetical protein